MALRSILQEITTRIAKSDLSWKLLRPFALFGFNIVNARKQFTAAREDHFDYSGFFKDLTVMNGPFKGMRYPRLDAVGSAIYPKLIGSYESELHPLISVMAGNDYSEIIDVGCAEGYYATGLGMMFPAAAIYAYDIDAKARSLCREMASLNGIAERMEIREACTAGELESFPVRRKALILSDCEGFERQLFTPSNLDHLRNCDIIIEAHDFLDIGISDDLEKMLATTHRVQRIKSVDDIEKARVYRFSETQFLPPSVKLNLFAESRPHMMEWLVAFGA